MGRTVQITFLAACALLAGCGGQPAVKISWTEYHDPAGKFSVLMPSMPEEKKTTNENPFGKSEIASYTATLESARFIVAYEEFPADYAQQQGAALLQNAITSSRRSGTSPLGQTAITVGAAPGMEYEVQDQVTQPPRVLKGRLVLVNNRLYDVVVEALPGAVAPADITKFLESFKPAG